MTGKHCFVSVALIGMMGCAQVSGQSKSELELTGTTWRATSINRTPVRAGVESTLSFPEPGRIGGKAGCNQYFGPVTIDGTRLQFGLMGSTRMMCPPEQMDQEDAFLHALEHVTHFDVQDGKLELYGDDEGEPVVVLEKVG